jgi:hypothetical protein
MWPVTATSMLTSKTCNQSVSRKVSGLVSNSALLPDNRLQSTWHLTSLNLHGFSLAIYFRIKGNFHHMLVGFGRFFGQIKELMISEFWRLIFGLTIIIIICKCWTEHFPYSNMKNPCGLLAILLKFPSSVFWVIVPCSRLKPNRRFGGTSQERNQSEAASKHCIAGDRSVHNNRCQSLKSYTFNFDADFEEHID